MVTALLCFGLRMVGAQDLWWTLSRGRAVLEGHFAPSSALLVAEDRAEADWLGGVPFLAAYRFAGVAGLMLIRAAGLLLVALLVWRATRHWPRSAAGWWTLGSLVALMPAFEPSPLLVDTLAVAVLWNLAGRSGPGHLATGIGLAATFVCWANLAPRPALGILLFSVHRMASCGPGVIGRMCLVILAGLAASLTPRGLLGLWDSLLVVVPPLAADLAVLARTEGLQPLGQSPWGPAELAFVAIGAVAVFGCSRASAGWNDRLAVALCWTLATTSTGNLAPAALWLALAGGRLLDEACWQARSIQRGIGPLGSWVAIGSWPLGLAVAVLCATIWVPRPAGPLGWGLHPSLELAPVAQSLAAVSLRGSAHCVGERAAGMVAWLRPPGIRPYDIGQRALTGGRLAHQVLVDAELAQGRSDPHHRDDGTEGGYWSALRKRGTALVVVPIERTDVLMGLRDSVWRPLASDGWTIPMGFAGEKGSSPRIVVVLRQQQAIERGMLPIPPSSVSGEGFDLADWLTGRSRTEYVLIQARASDAMGLPVTALRLLAAAIRADPDDRLREQFASLQHLLAAEERMTCGQPSLFRTKSANAAARTKAGAVPIVPESPTDALAEAVAMYVRGRVEEALACLRNRSRQGGIDGQSSAPESLYARARLAIEAGHGPLGIDEFERLITRYPEHPLSTIARHEIGRF